VSITAYLGTKSFRADERLASLFLHAEDPAGNQEFPGIGLIANRNRLSLEQSRNPELKQDYIENLAKEVGSAFNSRVELEGGIQTILYVINQMICVSIKGKSNRELIAYIGPAIEFCKAHIIGPMASMLDGEHKEKLAETFQGVAKGLIVSMGANPREVLEIVNNIITMNIGTAIPVDPKTN
jgi:hypothetical protein